MSQQSRPTRPRDAEATRARLLQAATEEFAAHGIAGARVDRIGAAAGANKALIYTYFGNKEQLFDAVMDVHVTRVLDQVPFTPEDLPGYAGRLFDFLLANPHQLRLATWHRLERSGTGHEPGGLRDSMRQKTEAVAAAQAGGQVPDTLGPEDLLTFTLALASAWTPTSPMAPASGRDAREHRDAVVEAVRRLVAG
ncbi:TetR family transcriptional regulator [Actinomadura sp. ATCC 31491]|uniref:TetR family transcriptional regulator n=1 Tax=Actinomadura luzonensis TaxID=2805427 RepID=A0ABT0FJ06_9ACTN|nr:TetR family transcriptional regulator [Actinomadura luzonensis]MCK2212285.1 TetR family transcriptional regulator [Actinomadura luzonensis]